MRHEDLLRSEEVWPGYEQQALNTQLVEDIRSGPVLEYSDLEIVETLSSFLESQLVEYGTSAQHIIDDEDARLLIITLGIVCRRLQIDPPVFPFNNLTRFREYWRANGMSGSWAARREYIENLFEPLNTVIQQKLIESFDDQLVRPVSWGMKPSWEAISNEIAHLRRRFSTATNSQDYSAIGLACVRIIEFLADVTFDPEIHLPEGEEVPHRGQPINRLGYVIDHHLSGSENQRLRKLVRSAVELTQEIKHSGHPSRRDASIGCDITIALVGIFDSIVKEESVRG